MITRFTLVLCLLAGLSPARAQTNSSKLTAPQALPAAPRVHTLRRHILAEGETLWTLAVQYGLSVKAIKDANRFDDADHLPAGTEVSLPAKPAYSLGGPCSEFKPVSFVQPNTPAQPMLPEPPSLQAAPDLTDTEGDQAGDGAGELAPVEVSIPKGRGRKRSSATADSGFIWPVDGFVISPFGKRRRRHIHAGVDLKAPRGTEVHAARDGWVVFSGTIRGHGRVVVLEHEDGWHTVYAHNQKNLVSPEKDGERMIRAGELIALVGASGNATTPHVHFEIRKDERPLDPMRFLPAQ